MDSSRIRNLSRIRSISRIMDSALRIPGTRFRVGIDPIIGLIPGAGDIVATAISAYLIVLAARFRLPWPMLRHMIFNVGLEAVVGAIPLFGDLFDAYYKSNLRNLRLLEAHLESSDQLLLEAAGTEETGAIATAMEPM
ncbi:MAG: DUF4112 domain-containing protein [Synechococcales cyanobacterium RM1_1_8]|nr:DUF4112 domain-containing protein [Synechococcales cyanobacterium RM1_1_8]